MDANGEGRRGGFSPNFIVCMINTPNFAGMRREGEDLMNEREKMDPMPMPNTQAPFLKFVVCIIKIE
jgi:hypothetical protein